MKHLLIAVLIWQAAACAAQAHFTFVVPDATGATVRIIMSETLNPDPQIDIGLIGGSDLLVRDAENREAPLSLTRTGEVFTAPLPGSGTRVVHGLTDLGVMNRGKAHVLLYYPKAIVGYAFDSKTKVGGMAVVEIVPVGRAGDMTLQLLAHGKPHGNAEITVILPDGTSKVVRTDEHGRTEKFTATGRYGAWARFWEETAGERDGTRYEQVRHYATLVFDAETESSQAAPDTSSTASNFATLPEATSSFGAASENGWLYIYGGHISPTHVYSTEGVSGRFSRIRLEGETNWEELPGGRGLQGMNLAAHDGFIYRVGGMAPRNAPGEAADNHSVADVARFNTSTKMWEELPALPEPRSSHDVVVLNEQLIVVGGWTMKGDEQEWAETILVMDLGAEEPTWRAVQQPFRRRALMAAAFQGKMYVIGGFTDQNQVVRNASIYDSQSDTWSEGPPLPQVGQTTGFAPAVVVHDQRLYVSVSEGSIFRLSESGQAWEKAGSSTPRVAHRLISMGESVLVIGGASGGSNFDLIEAIHVGRSQ